jgi:hypothetical protein
LPPNVKQATLKQLLHKETKLLQTIDRLKIAANHENRDVRIAKTLADMASAKRWECDDGSVVEVHTPFTTRAKAGLFIAAVVAFSRRIALESAPGLLTQPDPTLRLQTKKKLVSKFAFT